MEQKFYKTYKITQWKFWQNFWDYYKLHVFFALLVIALVVVGARSCATRIESDLMITYIGEKEMFSSQNIEELLKDKIEDIDGDDRKTIDISTNALAEDETLDMTIAVLNRIDADLMAGDPFILVADDEFVHRFVNMSALQPITEVAAGLEIPEENVLRDPKSNEIVAIDITNMPIGKLAGVVSGEKMYIGMKIMPYSKLDNEKYLALHGQAVDAIKIMLEYN